MAQHQERPVPDHSHLVPVEAYTPSPAVKVAFGTAVTSGFVGLLVSSLQNALQKHDKGGMGVFTRTGGTIGIFALAGGTFAFVDRTVANMREKDDWRNGAAGGCAAGFIAGLRSGNLQTAFGTCLITSVVVGTYDAAGGRFTGDSVHNMTPEQREERRQKFFRQRKEDDPE